MSWDVILFNSKQKISSIDEIDESQLEPTDFCSVLENNFNNIIIDNNHREIKGNEFSIDFFIDQEKVSNKIINLYGENGLYEIILLAKKNNWQIFDTSLNEIINLDNPSKNGYNNFINYLKQIIL